jgi:hypothetical protein
VDNPETWLNASAWLEDMSHLSSVPSDPDQLRVWLSKRGGAPAEALRRGLGNRAVELPSAPQKTRALTVLVTLRDTEPPVWRRLVVPGDLTLDGVHEVVQAAMGWSDAHSHRFYAGASTTDPHFVSAAEAREGDPGTPEAQARLDQLLRTPGDVVLHEYDVQRRWEHELRLERVGPLGDQPRARCIHGEQPCPPEGGRAGSTARAFTVEEVDQRLLELSSTEALLARLRPEATEALSRLSPASMARISDWLTVAARRSLSDSDVEELATPYQLLLSAVGPGVRLTAAGYLPAELVQVLCPALGVHPTLAGKANRESNIAPLRMFRTELERVALLTVSTTTLKRTADGRRLRTDAPALWQHVKARLPPTDGLGGELDAEIGWFTLLALGGGIGHRELFDAVHALTVESGWLDEHDRTISRRTVNQLMWRTLVALLGPRWNNLQPWPSWLAAAAASAVLIDR